MRVKKELIINIVFLLIYFGGSTLLYIDKVNNKKLAFEFLEKRPQISDLSEYDIENRLLMFKDDITEIKNLCKQLSILSEEVKEMTLFIEKDIENKIVDNVASELKSLLDYIYEPLDKKMNYSNLFLYGYIVLMPLIFRIFRKKIIKNNAQQKI